MILPPFGNEFLSPSKNIILKGHPILYPLKQIYICDYNTICLMLSGLMFDYIIINMIRNKSLEFYSDGIDSSSKNIDNNRIYMYRVSLQYYYWEKGTHEIIHVACLHFNVERTKMRQYLTNILNVTLQVVI